MKNSMGRLSLLLAAAAVFAPLCVAEAKDPLKPSKPSDESWPRYCRYNLVQKELNSFVWYCENVERGHGGHSHCSVDLSTNRFVCCCTGGTRLPG